MSGFGFGFEIVELNVFFYNWIFDFRYLFFLLLYFYVLVLWWGSIVFLILFRYWEFVGVMILLNFCWWSFSNVDEIEKKNCVESLLCLILNLILLNLDYLIRNVFVC